MYLKNPLEKRLVSNFLRLESCLSEKNKKLFGMNKRYLRGFRKGFLIIDLEKSIRTYFRVLGMVRSLSQTTLKIAFLGCPQYLENRISSYIQGRHLFFTLKEWNLGYLSNSRNFKRNPDLAIVFGQNGSFSFKESHLKNIPSVGFLDPSSSYLFVDYPIFLNLRSKNSMGLFLYLINQSITRN